MFSSRYKTSFTNYVEVFVQVVENDLDQFDHLTVPALKSLQKYQNSV